MLFVNTPGYSQSNNAAAPFSAADSSKFSVNKAGGWQLYNSTLYQYTADSISIELVLEHANNLNWKQENYVGKIKYLAFIPLSQKNLSFILLNDSYQLRIETDGKCYIRWLSGTLPAGQSVVLAMQVKYKS